MKKFLIWFGGIVLSLILIFVILMAYAALGKPNWDRFSEEHAKTVVGNFAQMNEEEFNRYWGDHPPGTKAQRDALINYAASFGHLETIDDVKRVHYTQHVALNGIHRYYVYDVHATYSNSPALIRLWFHIYGDSLTVQNMTINTDSSHVAVQTDGAK